MKRHRSRRVHLALGPPAPKGILQKPAEGLGQLDPTVVFVPSNRPGERRFGFVPADRVGESEKPREKHQRTGNGRSRRDEPFPAGWTEKGRHAPGEFGGKSVPGFGPGAGKPIYRPAGLATGRKKQIPERPEKGSDG